MSGEELEYSRLWRCTEDGCDEKAWVSYEALAEIGTPICPNCDCVMELTDDDEAPAQEADHA